MRLALRTAVVLATMSPSLVHAHGGRPQTYDVVFDPSDPDTLVVPATFGTLVSRDGGASWQSLCIHAMPDPRPGTLRSFVLTGAGSPDEPVARFRRRLHARRAYTRARARGPSLGSRRGARDRQPPDGGALT